jgi:hypothetical protein
MVRMWFCNIDRAGQRQHAGEAKGGGGTSRTCQGSGSCLGSTPCRCGGRGKRLYVAFVHKVPPELARMRRGWWYAAAVAKKGMVKGPWRSWAANPVALGGHLRLRRVCTREGHTRRDHVRSKTGGPGTPCARTE